MRALGARALRQVTACASQAGYTQAMKLLVLGGTRFLGRHLVEQALERGHDVTLLHRGRSHSGLFPQAAHLLADRDGDLSVLAGGRWDAAIDTSAYVPRQVHALGPVLGTRVGHYQLVSSISAYAGFNPGETDEDAPTATLDDPATHRRHWAAEPETAQPSHGPARVLRTRHVCLPPRRAHRARAFIPAGDRAGA